MHSVAIARCSSRDHLRPLHSPPASPSHAPARPQSARVCGLLEVRKTACRLAITAIVRRETSELADSFEYPVTKYAVEDMTWPVFKRSGGMDLLDSDLYQLLETRSKWWTEPDDWLLLLRACFGKSRNQILFSFSQPCLPRIQRALLPVPAEVRRVDGIACAC